MKKLIIDYLQSLSPYELNYCPVGFFDLRNQILNGNRYSEALIDINKNSTFCNELELLISKGQVMTYTSSGTLNRTFYKLPEQKF